MNKLNGIKRVFSITSSADRVLMVMKLSIPRLNLFFPDNTQKFVSEFSNLCDSESTVRVSTAGGSDILSDVLSLQTICERQIASGINLKSFKAIYSTAAFLQLKHLTMFCIEFLRR